MLKSDLTARKAAGDKLVMLTCYDYTFAKLLNDTSVDLLLVGDSLGMVVYGAADTRDVRMTDMARHTQAVARGNTTARIVADLPAGAFDTAAEAVANGRALIAAGAHAVKIEGGRDVVPLVDALIGDGIDVVGHVGLTPQTAEKYTVQGRDPQTADRILADARALAAAGVCAIVLEMIPQALAQRVTAAVDVPTIGIGAGPDTDGQVLVIYDMLGLFRDFKPKFVKRYADLGAALQTAVQRYCDEVRAGVFPDADHSYR
jgi:3-methyl-2-oxobutanoate hydroxymethyltransferase